MEGGGESHSVFACLTKLTLFSIIWLARLPPAPLKMHTISLRSAQNDALPPEIYTFAPKLAHEHALSEKAVLAESLGTKNYMEETASVKSQFDSNAAKARRIERQRHGTGPNGSGPNVRSRFEGFGSLWHDLNVGGARELGRTSPSEETPTFTPTLTKFHSDGGSGVKSKVMEVS